MTDITSQIRTAVKDSGITPHKISRLAVIPHSCLQRFLAGHGMALANLQAVAQVVGLRISVTPIQESNDNA